LKFHKPVVASQEQQNALVVVVVCVVLPDKTERDNRFTPVQEQPENSKGVN